MKLEHKDFKLAVIFDQVLSVGGGYQQALNSALSLKKINIFLNFFVYPENIAVLNKHIEVVYIKFKIR